MNPPSPSLVSTRSVPCVRAFVCLKVASVAPVRMSWKATDPAEVEGDEQQTIVSCICWVCIFQKPGRERSSIASDCLLLFGWTSDLPCHMMETGLGGLTLD